MFWPGKFTAGNSFLKCQMGSLSRWCGKPVAMKWRFPTMGVPLYRWMVYKFYNGKSIRKWMNWGYPHFRKPLNGMVIELDYGKIYRKALYLMVKTMVSCRFSRKPIQWYGHSWEWNRGAEICPGLEMSRHLSLEVLALGNSIDFHGGFTGI